MRHITFGDKSLLMGDDAADALLHYAALLGDAGRADAVTVSAVSADGNTVDVAILLNANVGMVVESTNSTIESPDNTEAVRYMKERIDALLHPPTARIETPGSAEENYDPRDEL